MSTDKKEEQIKQENSEVEKSDETIFEKYAEKLGQTGAYLSEKKNLKTVLAYSFAVNAGLLVILLFFSVSFMTVLNNRDVTVVVPPGTHNDLSLTFGATRVNRKVYELYSDYLARAFGNFNYETVDKIFDNLLNYADGSVKHQFRLILNNKAKIVKDNFVTQTFKLERIELDRDSRGTLAKCYGYATRKVGKEVQFDGLPYLMIFWFKSYAGNASIIGMSSSINHNPSNSREKLKVDSYETDNKYINF